MQKCSIDILDLIFTFVNGTNYFYVNKLFYSIVKNRIKKLKTQICLDFLNDNEPYCKPLGNLYEIDLSHNNEIFLDNCGKFVNISVKNHKIIMDYIFFGLSKNFYVAGGSIVGILKWNDMNNNKFKKSDIDIYYIGNKENASKDIYESIKTLKNMDIDFKILKTKNTITLYHPTFRNIQFILKIYESLNELFAFFDFDVVCMAYKNSKVICSFKTAIMLNQKLITMDYHYVNIFMERLRCHKYFKKGFNLVVKKELPYYNQYMYEENGVKYIISADDYKNINPYEALLNQFLNDHIKKYIKSYMKFKNYTHNTIMNMAQNNSKKTCQNINNLNTYNLNKFNYSEYDKIEERSMNYTLEKCDDFIDTYSDDGIFFKDTTYNDIHENEITLDDVCNIKIMDKFDLKHLNIRYKIDLCVVHNKYHFLQMNTLYNHDKCS